jgi:Tfp pilus assembly protein PilV
MVQKHCGHTLVETMVAAGITVVLILATLTFGGWVQRSFSGSTTRAQAQKEAEHAMQWMELDLRAARSLASGTVLTGSTPTLVLQMPAYDSSGALSAPVTNGNTVTYSVSSDSRRLTRVESANGSTVSSTVVASVDQYSQLSVSYSSVTSDTNGDGQIGWDEYVSLIPRITVTARVGAGTSAYDSVFSTTQEVKLRNR